MKMMGRKGAVVLVLGLGVAYAAASWWTGRQLESRYALERGRLLAMLGIEPAQLTGHHYARGIFSSTVRDVLVLHLPPLPPAGVPYGWWPGAQPVDVPQAGGRQPVRVHLRQDIRHGPLPGLRWGAVAIDVRVERVEGLAGGWQKALERASSPALRSVIGFDGSERGEIRWPDGEFTLPGPAGVQLSWKTLVYDYQVDSGRRQGQGRWHWPQFRMRVNPSDRRQPAMHVEIVGWRLEHRTGPVDEQWLMPLGSTHGRIERLSIRTAGPAPAPETNFVTWEQAETHSTIRQEGERLQMVAGMLGKGMLGGIAFDEMRTENRISGVDPQVLRDVQPRLLKALLADLAGEGQEEAVLAARSSMQEVISRLLAMKPVYQDRLSAWRDGREGSLQTEVTVQDVSPLSSDAALDAQLAARTRTDIAARLPRAWAGALAGAARQPRLDARALTELADGLVARQVLRSDGEHWLVDARVQASRLLLNGQPLSGP